MKYRLINPGVTYAPQVSGNGGDGDRLEDA
jgi:hypothetical protein